MKGTLQPVSASSPRGTGLSEQLIRPTLSMDYVTDGTDRHPSAAPRGRHRGEKGLNL